MEKNPYFLVERLDNPPYSQVWVYSDNSAIQLAAQEFEYARLIFTESDKIIIYLNPQYPNEHEVVEALRKHLNLSLVDDVWKDFIDNIDDTPQE